MRYIFNLSPTQLCYLSQTRKLWTLEEIEKHPDNNSYREIFVRQIPHSGFRGPSDLIIGFAYRDKSLPFVYISGVGGIYYRHFWL